MACSLIIYCSRPRIRLRGRCRFWLAQKLPFGGKPLANAAKSVRVQ